MTNFYRPEDNKPSNIDGMEGFIKIGGVLIGLAIIILIIIWS